MFAHQMPVFVGITGKRELDRNLPRNLQLMDVVRQRFDAVLDRLDDELPGVAKVFLTGGATGVDLLTARQVLGLNGAAPRPGWLVTVVLPFEPALFREDFDDATEWTRLSQVLDHPGVRCAILPRLRTDLPRPDGLDPAIDVLSRANEAAEWKDLRRRHYEQVGLWIVDNANILLAVMSEHELADKIGGTARIVAFRRGGRPDQIADEVIAASGAPLAPRPPLVRPPQQYVWLLDPANDKADPALPISVLPPIVEHGATRRAYEHPGQGSVVAMRDKHLEGSLATAKTIERLAAGGGRTGEARWPDEQCPATVVKGIREAQRGVRSKVGRLSKGAFYGLGGLFVLAVLAFEVFAKFAPTNQWVLLPYIVLLALIMILYLWAQYWRWQPDTEDSRAVAELLRLQYAWWRAGLDVRVDHIHLQGADEDLARVRDAARSAITWAWLAARGRPATVNWPEVWQPERPAGMSQERRDWIGEQCHYFEKTEKARERRAACFDLLSWSLFMTSFCLALQLFFWLWSESLRHRIETGALWFTESSCGIGFAIALGIAVAVTAWMLRIQLSKPDRPQPILALVLAVVASLGLGLSLRMSGEVFAILGNGDAHGHGEKYTRYLVIVMIVGLPAIAGAMRFVSEKLAYEAEALSYREALRWFEHADELLARQPPGKGNGAADAFARSIVERLGRLALSENEAWLKSRRERPLSPVIGG